MRTELGVDFENVFLGDVVVGRVFISCKFKFGSGSPGKSEKDH